MSMREYYENLDQYAIYDYKDVKNAYGHGEVDAVDRVLDIITEREKYEKKLPTPNAFGFRLAVEQIKQGIEVMKEGKQG